MSETQIIVFAVLYWTFAVAVLALLREADPKQLWASVVVAIMWPILIPVIVVGLLYRVVVRSAKTIRDDLRNRKLLAEFDEFLKAKEVQK
jgi:cell division protein FtsX